MTTYECVERTIEENGLQPILDAKYNGSIVDFIRVNDLDDPFGELPIASYGVENLEDYILSIFAEDQYEIEQAEREAATVSGIDWHTVKSMLERIAESESESEEEEQ